MAHMATVWLSWGEVFLPKTAEQKWQEDHEAKKWATNAPKAAEKRWQQEADAEKARPYEFVFFGSKNDLP